VRRAIFDRELRLVREVVNVIAVDVRGRSIEAIATELARSWDPNVLVLAENVATRQQLMLLRELGFDLFEGFFLDLVAIARRKWVAMVA
jgi:EAL and modified HD-GYP domain-containing signal transduction protein